MASTFRTKIRRIRGRLWIIIPKSVVRKEGLKEGDEIEVSVMKRRKIAELLKLMGTAKGAKPFERDHTDRSDRW